MSEIKAEEAAERLRQWVKAYSAAPPGMKADFDALLTERESLLKYKEAFEAMAAHGFGVWKDRKDGQWRITALIGAPVFAEGATPLEAVLTAKKGLDNAARS